ncbi:helix-turn-helix domain-containing protein [Mycolicibacterium septicum]|uniref:helix-turn-helix domain-containing protein n=1 Tax=Mycolicibacterium septicum TaxID=98668 RepID=UPI001F266E8F|nr:helix-turn-helix domain-containing protein [Mycolicibacterium septicum]
MRAILDSAEVLLAEQGYPAAALKAIGEHAGVPTASIYHYFADRGEVDAELAHLARQRRRVGRCDARLLPGASRIRSTLVRPPAAPY